MKDISVRFDSQIIEAILKGNRLSVGRSHAEGVLAVLLLWTLRLAYLAICAGGLISLRSLGP
jgi:hypothetical protein